MQRSIYIISNNHSLNKIAVHDKTSTILKTYLKNIRRVGNLASEGESKAKIIITRPDFPSNGIELLKEKYDLDIFSEKGGMTKDDVMNRIIGKSGIFCCLNDEIDKDILHAAGPSLKVVSTMSVGINHIDVEECRKLGIRVGHTPIAFLTEATAELTVALLLATSRRLFEANNQLRAGGWTSWSPNWMVGHGLNDSVIGLVGFGRVGREIGRKLKVFDVAKLLYTDPSKKIKPEMIEELGAEKVELNHLLTTADFVITACELTPQTKDLFSTETFNLMKPSSIFVNTSRGGIVDHDALYIALKEGKIGAAGLDVMTPEPLPINHPLLTLSNCVLLPHIGGATFSSRKAQADVASRNIIAALEGRPMTAEYIR